MGKKKNPRKSKISKSQVDPGNQTRRIVFIIGLLLVLSGFYGVLHNSTDTEEWSVSDEGILSYPPRGDVEYSIQVMENPDNTDVLKTVSFKSRDTYINGILRIPESGTEVAGIVLLPGAGVTKEEEQGLASELSMMGYASLVLDQRNLGGIDPNKDLEMFKQGAEPVEYRTVYDALKAADVLRDQPGINAEKIAIIGSSNGGRFAIIATAIDPSIKGVVGISTGGYDMDSIDTASVADEQAYRFYRSIDPDIYIGFISPRRVVMLHSLNDSVIPYSIAQKTFERAGEPGSIHTVNDTVHGFTS
ncbi:MAG: acetylxylan esterase, partial [Methanosarcinaceae archaeon]|nr:acetylxylan esterase [Methanosarcinaceae archaeon]